MVAKETKKQAAARAARERLTKAATRERQSSTKDLSHPVFALAAERAKGGFGAAVRGRSGEDERRSGASMLDSASADPNERDEQDQDENAQGLGDKPSSASQVVPQHSSIDVHGNNLKPEQKRMPTESDSYSPVPKVSEREALTTSAPSSEKFGSDSYSGLTVPNSAPAQVQRLRSTGGKTVGSQNSESIAADWEWDFSQDRDFVESYVERLVDGGARMAGFVQFYSKLYKLASSKKESVLYFTRDTLLGFTHVKSNDTLTDWLKRGQQFELFSVVVLRFSKGSFAAGTYILLRYPWLNNK